MAFLLKNDYFCISLHPLYAMINGFLRVAAAVPPVNVADVKANVNAIISMASELDRLGVELCVMPEMCVTAYTCGDLFHSRTLLDSALKGVEAIAEASRQWNLDLVVGAPLEVDGVLRNCAIAIGEGKVKLVVGKHFLPNYNEFYERRWFAPAPADQPRIFESHGVKVGIEICEELWAVEPPSGAMSLRGAQVIVNLSASDDLIGKYDYLRSLITGQSGRCLCGYAYASAGFGESTTDLVFTPKAMIAECGTMIAENNRWQFDSRTAIADIDIEAIARDRIHNTTFAASQEDLPGRPTQQIPATPPTGITDTDILPEYRKVNPRPFVPDTNDALNERCNEIIDIQTAGLVRRLGFIHAKSLTVGISGGLDSTLALLVAHRAFTHLGLDPKGIIGVTMPGFGTTTRTRSNATKLMERLGVTIREIPIGAAVNQHFKDIGHDPEVRDITYENSQARMRTMILMDVANQTGGIVLGTGDLSELALGWATYNGDHMSMYGVNAGVPKTLVRHLVNWFATTATDHELATTLTDIVATPVSPELLPPSADGTIAQITEDNVGPYELHDFFLYQTLRYGFSPERIFILARKAFSPEAYPSGVIAKWLDTFFRRFFSQQFKRSCLPDGPKVGSVCLSPRGDWRMPSDASSAEWLAATTRLKEKYKS